MGTHRYLVEAFVCENPKKKDLHFLCVNPLATQYYAEFGDTKGKVPRLLLSHGCREALVNQASLYKGIVGKNCEKNSHILIAYRMFGEQYSSVAVLLKKYGVVKFREIFSDVISKTLHLTIDVDFGTIPSKDTSKKLPIRRLIKYQDKSGIDREMLTDKFITVYLDFPKEKFVRMNPMMISTIAAILREPVVISGIMEGEITDNISMAKALANISIKRLRGTDSSYQCLNICPEKREPAITTKMIAYLKQPQNHDGSDWLSTLRLSSLFFYMIGSKRLVDVYNGPSSFMQVRWTLDFLRKFRKAVLTESMARTIAAEEARRRIDRFSTAGILEQAMS
jgi:hypothetical protein